MKMLIIKLIMLTKSSLFSKPNHQPLLLLIFLVFMMTFLGQSIHAGVYVLNGSTQPASSGLVFTNNGSPSYTVNSTVGTGINLIGGAGDDTLIISGFNVGYGKRWEKMVISASVATITVSLLDYLGNVLIDSQNVFGTQTFDISKFDAAKNGRGLSVKITGLSSGANLTELILSYNGNNLFAFPSPFVPRKQTLKFGYDQPNSAQVKLQIYDQTGKLVRSILDNEIRAARSGPLDNPPTWDGTDSNGQLVATGVYIAYLEVKFLNSNNYSAQSGGAAVSDYNQSFRFVVYR